VSIWYSKKKKLGEVRFYSTIKKLPLHNWEQMNLSFDHRWLIVPSDRKRKVDEEKVREAYFRIYDEYADATGLHETMEGWADLMKMRIEARVEVAHGDRSAINRVEMYGQQIDNLMKDNGDSNVIKNRMLVQQAYRLAIQPKEISLYEYLMIKQIVEDQINHSEKPTEDGPDD